MSAGAKKAMADQENKTAEIVSPTPEPASERGHRDRSRRRHRNQPRHLEPRVIYRVLTMNLETDASAAPNHA